MRREVYSEKQNAMLQSLTVARTSPRGSAVSSNTCFLLTLRSNCQVLDRAKYRKRTQAWKCPQRQPRIVQPDPKPRFRRERSLLGKARACCAHNLRIIMKTSHVPALLRQLSDFFPELSNIHQEMEAVKSFCKSRDAVISLHDFIDLLMRIGYQSEIAEGRAAPSNVPHAEPNSEDLLASAEAKIVRLEAELAEFRTLYDQCNEERDQLETRFAREYELAQENDRKFRKNQSLLADLQSKLYELEQTKQFISRGSGQKSRSPELMPLGGNPPPISAIGEQVLSLPVEETYIEAVGLFESLLNIIRRHHEFAGSLISDGDQLEAAASVPDCLESLQQANHVQMRLIQTEEAIISKLADRADVRATVEKSPLPVEDPFAAKTPFVRRRKKFETGEAAEKSQESVPKGTVPATALASADTIDHNLSPRQKPSENVVLMSSRKKMIIGSIVLWALGIVTAILGIEYIASLEWLQTFSVYIY